MSFSCDQNLVLDGLTAVKSRAAAGEQAGGVGVVRPGNVYRVEPVQEEFLDGFAVGAAADVAALLVPGPVGLAGRVGKGGLGTAF